MFKASLLPLLSIVISLFFLLDIIGNFYLYYFTPFFVTIPIILTNISFFRNGQTNQKLAILSLIITLLVDIFALVMVFNLI